MFQVNSQKVLRDHTLSKGARLLMGEIVTLDKSPLGCFASNKYFGEAIGVQPRAIQKYLVELKEKGYIDTREIVDEERKKERLPNYTTRIIAPTKSILSDIEKKVKNFKRFSKELPKDIESDWLEKWIDNL